MDYSKHLSSPPPQTPRRGATPAPLPGMVPGSSGPETWPVDDWTRLDRFLILGHEGGSYYASEQKMTKEAAEVVRRCLTLGPARTIARIVEVSTKGRAPKNDPAIFALALCAAEGEQRLESGGTIRQLAFWALPQVCRIGTHLFHFLRDYEALRPKGRYGRSVRRALAGWYENKQGGDLAYELLKYRQRDGWSHRDVLRLAHPAGRSADHAVLYRWATHGLEEKAIPQLPPRVLAYERMQVLPGSKPSETFIGTAVNAIREHRLPWEAVAPELRSEPGIWRALLGQMPYEATVRNLAAMTRNGALAGVGPELDLVLARLGNRDLIRKARFHPIKALVALRTYASGQPLRGRGEGWAPIKAIVQALDEAFYQAFDATLEARPQRLVLALDVSGSMEGGDVAGIPGLSPRNASAALALVFMRQFPQHEVVCFSASGTRLGPGRSRGWSPHYGGDAISRLPLTPGLRLDQAEAVVSGLDFGATDCSLPMRWAQEQKVQADAFVILTDSETNSHGVHPSEALKAYRRASGIRAKLVVVGMVSNGFSIADPSDAGMLDVVGFDTVVPQLVADFISGELGQGGDGPAPEAED